MKTRIVRRLIEWLHQRYPYLMQEVVIGHGAHIHRNPRKKYNA